MNKFAMITEQPSSTSDRSKITVWPFTVAVRKFAMKTIFGLKLVIVAGLVLFASGLNAQEAAPEDKAAEPAVVKDPAKQKESPVKAAVDSDQVATVPDSKHVGGEPDGVVQVANLVYANTKSSECFADHFLVQAEQESSISTSRRFHAVKLVQRRNL